MVHSRRTDFLCCFGASHKLKELKNRTYLQDEVSRTVDRTIFDEPEETRRSTFCMAE
jgi:hypothetical protein